MARKIGLDIGSSSLGWLVSEDGETIKKGVVVFDTGMSKGQSGGYVSPTRERREARSKRNLIRARKYRKWALLKVLIENDLVPINTAELEIWCRYKKGQTNKFPENKQFLKWLKCDFSYLGIKTKYVNPYDLRINSIDNKVSNHEFGRALYHIVQRRGYKDIGEIDTETEKQITRRSESGFQKALDENRTVAEALKNEFLNKNERARNQYPYRDEYRKELEEICKKQGYDISKNAKGIYNNTFVFKLWKAIIWQRPLRTQKGNIGKCALETKKLRCPISHPVFEIFRTWSFINTINYLDENGEKQPLSNIFKQNLFEWFLKKEANFKFEDIRIFLDKKFGQHNKYNYPLDKKQENKSKGYEIEEGIYDTSVSGMPVCKGLIDIFGENIKQGLYSIENYNLGNLAKKGGFGNAPKCIDNYSVYDLWHAVFSFDEIFLEKFAINKLGIQNTIRKRKGIDITISPLVELKKKFLQGYCDLSLKAMCNILPFLKQGYLYNEAVVLAKIPELTADIWEEQKEKIITAAKAASQIYEWNKTIIDISNKLIDKWKGDKYFADKDFSYSLQQSDIVDIEKMCRSHLGEISWMRQERKDEIINAVKDEYSEFFKDNKRSYRKGRTLTDTFNELLSELKIGIAVDKLYHHSNINNKYTQKCQIEPNTEKPILPKAMSKFGYIVEILPNAIIDSIKNPMFNKSMSILRKLINELIKDGTIDKETEVIIELARELNDNNKRIAIERYQNERKNKREKYREFLKEFSIRENRSFNIEESLATFELWSEQTFAETKDEKGNKIRNKDHHEILREKEAIKRYELWIEQKGQCIYSGRVISITKLFSSEIDIMHTIPRSLLPDNTMANMTVGFSSYNRDLQQHKLPKQCENYSKDVENWGAAIEPRLEKWKQIRDHYKKLFEERLKPKGNEDENSKNKRIQDRHYFKLHYDYWNDKVARFEADEISDKWARRQIVDTQMTTKYAREFLKTYFNKVAVQKGAVTAVFRKIYGFQEETAIKSRNRHTHHAIDALVLTLIPSNSSQRECILKDYFKAIEENKNIHLFGKYDSQKHINNIEKTTLIYNYEKDKVLKQTAKTIRKRGVKQYLKDKNGKFILINGEKILLKAKGDTVRKGLFAQTYLGKIRIVERDENGNPQKSGNGWKFKTGDEEYSFVVRKPIKDALSKIDDIVDPILRNHIRKQKNNNVIKDFQGKEIRHVRIKVKAGKEVKERLNFRSKHHYKNKFYAEAGSIPYAILLEKFSNSGDERRVLPITSHEISKSYKQFRNFNIEQYIQKNNSNYSLWNKTLLKVGQKVFVLNEDAEYEMRNNNDFQRNRMYVITQFSDGSIWLKYHLNALAKEEIKNMVSLKKDEVLLEYEKQSNLSEIAEDFTISDYKTRKEDFDKRRFRFDSIDNSFRLSRLVEKIGLEKVKLIKKELDQFKAIPSKIEIEGETALLKTTNWNFLVEGRDFKMNIDGSVNFDFQLNE